MMTPEQAIQTLEINRDANSNKPKFFEACSMAITAIQENKQLKNRCYLLSLGSMCALCGMECDALGSIRKTEGR